MTEGRQSLSKSLRFEVLKRDSFKCQYCGAEAPTVLLHIDHIEPVSKGGTNDITNLITACDGCNLGKGATALSDHVAVKKSRAQMDDLQDRREQLELMMEWRKGLREVSNEALDGIASYWDHYTPGRVANANGRNTLARLLEKFSVEEICTAMDVAARSYLQFDDEGKTTLESWNTAFAKIGGICMVNRTSETNPDIKELFYIRGILRNRLSGYFDPAKAIQLLKIARSWDVPVSDLKDIALHIRNWSQFRAAVIEAIEEAKDREDTAAWEASQVKEGE